MDKKTEKKLESIRNELQGIISKANEQKHALNGRLASCASELEDAQKEYDALPLTDIDGAMFWREKIDRLESEKKILEDNLSRLTSEALLDDDTAKEYMNTIVAMANEENRKHVKEVDRLLLDLYHEYEESDSLILKASELIFMLNRGAMKDNRAVSEYIPPVGENIGQILNPMNQYVIRTRLAPTVGKGENDALIVLRM